MRKVSEMDLYCAHCIDRILRRGEQLTGFNALKAKADTMLDGTLLCESHLIVAMDMKRGAK